jgi:hypothetical protein
MNIGALRALVIGLAVLILIVFAAVVYGIVGLAGPDSNGAVAGDAAGGVAAGLRARALDLPEGCEFRNAQSSGNRLTIVTDGPAGLRETCMRVWVFDLATGETLAEIRP